MDKPNSCNTCALKVSLSQTDTASTDRVEEIYAEFLRRNKCSNRRLSVGGDDDNSMFCALGSRHFKKGGTNCCQWVPAIGLSIADALAINLNRKIYWLTLIIVVLTFLSIIGIFMPSKTTQPICQCKVVTTKGVPEHTNYNRESQPNQ
jgi:hypothetical protein